MFQAGINTRPAGFAKPGSAEEFDRSVRGKRPGMIVQEISPLVDRRWPGFVGSHPSASVFHTRAWLEALEKTFGYEPIAYTTSSSDGELENALVFCRVNSWLTGRRLVSLPFSDHCEPLLSHSDLAYTLSCVGGKLFDKGLRYIELRPLATGHVVDGIPRSSLDYSFHQLDLTPDLNTLVARFHKDSTRRKIRRAEREGLTCEEGRSDSLLAEFYRLFLLTRRRHQVPPQPKSWFRNLMNCLGNGFTIRVAFRGRQAIAAIITLQFRDTITYKYGCSDARFHNLGGTQLLFWQSIMAAKTNGFSKFDLGRSDIGNAGLIRFKDQWGAARSTLTYWRYTTSANSAASFKAVRDDWKFRAAKQCFARMPTGILSVAGKMLYKHIG